MCVGVMNLTRMLALCGQDYGNVTICFSDGYVAVFIKRVLVAVSSDNNTI